MFGYYIACISLISIIIVLNVSKVQSVNSSCGGYNINVGLNGATLMGVINVTENNGTTATSARITNATSTLTMKSINTSTTTMMMFTNTTAMFTNTSNTPTIMPTNITVLHANTTAMLTNTSTTPTITMMLTNTTAILINTSTTPTMMLINTTVIFTNTSTMPTEMITNTSTTPTMMLTNTTAIFTNTTAMLTNTSTSPTKMLTNTTAMLTNISTKSTTMTTNTSNTPTMMLINTTVIFTNTSTMSTEMITNTSTTPTMMLNNTTTMFTNTSTTRSTMITNTTAILTNTSNTPTIILTNTTTMFINTTAMLNNISTTPTIMLTNTTEMLANTSTTPTIMLTNTTTILTNTHTTQTTMITNTTAMLTNITTMPTSNNNTNQIKENCAGSISNAIVVIKDLNNATYSINCTLNTQTQQIVLPIKLFIEVINQRGRFDNLNIVTNATLSAPSESKSDANANFIILSQNYTCLSEIGTPMRLYIATTNNITGFNSSLRIVNEELNRLNQIQKNSGNYSMVDISKLTSTLTTLIDRYSQQIEQNSLVRKSTYEVVSLGLSLINNLSMFEDDIDLDAIYLDVINRIEQLGKIIAEANNDIFINTSNLVVYTQILRLNSRVPIILTSEEINDVVVTIPTSILSFIADQINNTKARITVTNIKLNNNKLQSSISNIISLTFPIGSFLNGLSFSQLTETITLNFSLTQIPSYQQDLECQFLNTSTNSFSNEGVFISFASNSRKQVTCATTHLTSFGIFARNSNSIQVLGEVPLRIVSYVLLSISFIFLLNSLILFCASARNGFFKVEMNRLYFNYAVSLTLGTAQFIIGVNIGSLNYILCIVITIVTHYIWLATFSWSLCICITMVYLLTYGILKRRNIFWCMFILGWSLPVPFVIITLIVGLAIENYVSSAQLETQKYCFLSTESGLSYAFLIPILLIILVNMIGLVIALVKIISTSRSKKIAAISKKLITASLVLIPILGLPWIVLIIQLLVALSNDSLTYTFAEWLFVLLNAPIGIVFFFVFTCQSEEVRALFREEKKDKRSNLILIKQTETTCEFSTASELGDA